MVPALDALNLLKLCVCVSWLEDVRARILGGLRLPLARQLSTAVYP